MLLDNFRQDLRYALRGLRTRPGFTLAVVATLGLGLGANSAMFGIVDGLLFRPPALLKDPATTHRLYLYFNFRGKERANSGTQYARYADFARLTTAFSDVAQFTQRDLAVGVGDAARERSIGVVSANFFNFFNAPPALGRYFTAAEDQPPAGEPVAVLSYATWQADYAGRDVRGEKIQVGPVIYTVIGVSAPRFVGLWADKPPIAFIPITAYAATQGFGNANVNWWATYSWTWSSTMLRRKPGVTIAAANADLTHAYIESYRSQGPPECAGPSTRRVRNPPGTSGRLPRPSPRFSRYSRAGAATFCFPEEPLVKRRRLLERQQQAGVTVLAAGVGTSPVFVLHRHTEALAKLLDDLGEGKILYPLQRSGRRRRPLRSRSSSRGPCRRSR